MEPKPIIPENLEAKTQEPQGIEHKVKLWVITPLTPKEEEGLNQMIGSELEAIKSGFYKRSGPYGLLGHEY
jgi:hypothetical protein